jgi:hypothetical protein
MSVVNLVENTEPAEPTKPSSREVQDEFYAVERAVMESILNQKHVAEKVR